MAYFNNERVTLPKVYTDEQLAHLSKEGARREIAAITAYYSTLFESISPACDCSDIDYWIDEKLNFINSNMLSDGYILKLNRIIFG